MYILLLISLLRQDCAVVLAEHVLKPLVWTMVERGTVHGMAVYS